MADPVELNVERDKRALAEIAKRHAALLHDGSGGGTSDGMDTRITRLEEWSKIASERLGRIETKLDALPSRGDMIQLFLAMFVVLGLLFAGLAWLDSRAGRYAKEQAAAPTAPIVIQVPAPPPGPAPNTQASK